MIPFVAAWLVVLTLALVLAPYAVDACSVMATSYRAVKHGVSDYYAPLPGLTMALHMAYAITMVCSIPETLGRWHDAFDQWLHPNYYLRLTYLELCAM
jgi:hypothetical protein